MTFGIGFLCCTCFKPKIHDMCLHDIKTCSFNPPASTVATKSVHLSDPFISMCENVLVCHHLAFKF